ncbi:MAG: hypothetical protein U5R06_04230 [candidate division KSB1 bacterium]|nr:hypothetical protein [candidate division KSB1 bacterium]
MLKGVSHTLINIAPIASLTGRRFRTTIVAIDIPSLPGRGLCIIEETAVRIFSMVNKDI